jgi:hypothetical protein
MVKAKVNKAYLDKENNVIVWEVTLSEKIANKKEANFVWDRNDFWQMMKDKLGIRHDDYTEDAKTGLMEYFCEKILNQQVNLDARQGA